jgi:hypothetical protein
LAAAVLLESQGVRIALASTRDFSTRDFDTHENSLGFQAIDLVQTY